jgi:hypothetical protein
MVYLGYNFNSGKIKNIEKEPNCVQDSLSIERLNKAKEFLKSVENFIATQLDLFRATSALSKDTVAISIMENFTGQNGFPATE